MKTCTGCGAEKSLDDFYTQRERRVGKGRERRPMPHCKACHKEKEKVRRAGLSPEEAEAYYSRMRARKLLAFFGLTAEKYETLLEAQGGVCAICKRPETSTENRRGVTRVRRLAVDHDRKCCPGDKSCGECFRGLLCMTCNTRLGYFEKYSLFPALFSYLKIEVSS